MTEDEKQPDRIDALVPGQLIEGRYEIGRRLGQGGMGSVYWAADRKLGGKPRALKLLRLRPGDLHAAEAEAAMLMRLNHPRLPQLIDYIPAGPGQPAMLVTDFAEGENLSDYFERRGRRLPVREVIDIGVQLCGALAYLHAQSPPVVHRDLKPSNVMIDRTGFVRLIDFGIARLVRAGADSDTQLLGTPGFAAPEQAGEAGQSDPRSDIYALGALLRYLLSGGEPASAAAAADHPAAGLPAALPPGLKQAVASMLQRAPARRPAEAGEAERLLALAAVEAGAGENKRGKPVPPEGRISNGQGNPAAAATVIAVASFTPGAGGTFASVTLAKLLERAGAPVVLLEHPLLEPELFVLLGGNRAFARQSEAGKGPAPVKPLDGRFAAWRDRNLLIQALYPLAVEKQPAATDGNDSVLLTPDAVKQGLGQCLSGRQAAERAIVIADMSAHWMHAAAASWLAGSDLLLMAADPEPSKWTQARLAGWRDIAEQRESAGLPYVWAANKVAAFKGRDDWLRMFPHRPAALVPLLPFGEWRTLLWRGRWATDHPAWRTSLDRSLAPVFRRIFN